MTKKIVVRKPPDPLQHEIDATMASMRQRERDRAALAEMARKAVSQPAAKSGRLTPFIDGLRELADKALGRS